MMCMFFGVFLFFQRKNSGQTRQSAVTDSMAARFKIPKKRPAAAATGGMLLDVEDEEDSVLPPFGSQAAPKLSNKETKKTRFVDRKSKGLPCPGASHAQVRAREFCVKADEEKIEAKQCELDRSWEKLRTKTAEQEKMMRQREREACARRLEPCARGACCASCCSWLRRSSLV